MTEKALFDLKTYTWGGSSAISQMDVRGDGVAYLHAAKNATDLPQLRKLFETKGWGTSSDIRGGDDTVLRLTGFGNIHEVTSALQNAHAIEGKPQESEVVADRKTGHSAWSNLKASSLRASGIFYVIGNCLYSVYGHKSHDKDFRNVGVFWNIADVPLAIFGNKDDSREMSWLIKKMKNHFEENGIEVPHGSAMSAEALTKPGGALESAYDFMREHVTLFKSLAEVAGSVSMMKSAHHKRLNKESDWKQTQAAGAILMAGFGLAGLISEKKVDPEKYEKAHLPQKLWMKIQAQPLQLAGIAGVSNNIFNMLAVKKEHDTHVTGTKRHYKWRGLGVASLLLANVLYFSSHKTGGNIQSGSVVDDVYGMAAQVLDHMPPDAREIGIKQAADFLGERTELKENRQEIEARLRREITELQRNPWFGTEEMSGKSPTSGHSH